MSTHPNLMLPEIRGVPKPDESKFEQWWKTDDQGRTPLVLPAEMKEEATSWKEKPVTLPTGYPAQYFFYLLCCKWINTVPAEEYDYEARHGKSKEWSDTYFIDLHATVDYAIMSRTWESKMDKDKFFMFVKYYLALIKGYWKWRESPDMYLHLYFNQAPWRKSNIRTAQSNGLANDFSSLTLS